MLPKGSIRVEYLLSEWNNGLVSSIRGDAQTAIKITKKAHMCSGSTFGGQFACSPKTANPIESCLEKRLCGH